MMQFKEQKPIYLQIADLLEEYIIKGEWGNSERIPALREIAVQMEVNPNTVMRTYTYLQDKGIIYNKRGIGYFTAPDARQQILTVRMNPRCGGGPRPQGGPSGAARSIKKGKNRR